MMKTVVSNASNQSTLEDAYRKLQKLSYSLSNLAVDEQHKFEEITGISIEALDDAYRDLDSHLYQ